MHKDRLILVAEDDPVIGMVVVRHLSELGFVGHVAENGSDAVMMAERIPYCMILMDIQMPRMTGVEATIKIRQKESKDTRVPIVALTATTDRQTCKEAGMDDFVEKPITLERLKQVIEKWLGPLDGRHS